MRPLRSLVLFALAVALGSCATSGARQAYWSGFGHLENVLNWTPEQQLRGYRNMDRIYPTRKVTESHIPFALPTRRVDLSALRYAVESGTFDIDMFIQHNHVVGLLIVHNG